MIIDEITAEIVRKHVLARLSSPSALPPKMCVYIDDATFRAMRRESAKRDVLDPVVNELIADNTIMGCPVFQVYGKGHGWRVFVA